MATSRTLGTERMPYTMNADGAPGRSNYNQRPQDPNSILREMLMKELLRRQKTGDLGGGPEFQAQRRGFGNMARPGEGATAIPGGAAYQMRPTGRTRPTVQSLVEQYNSTGNQERGVRRDEAQIKELELGNDSAVQNIEALKMKNEDERERIERERDPKDQNAKNTLKELQYGSKMLDLEHKLATQTKEAEIKLGALNDEYGFNIQSQKNLKQQYEMANNNYLARIEAVKSGKIGLAVEGEEANLKRMRAGVKKLGELNKEFDEIRKGRGVQVLRIFRKIASLGGLLSKGSIQGFMRAWNQSGNDPQKERMVIDSLLKEKGEDPSDPKWAALYANTEAGALADAARVSTSRNQGFDEDIAGGLNGGSILDDF